MIYDERMRRVLYNYVPNTSSKKDIVQAMKENLELAEHKTIKSFSFSINSPYEKTVIGKGPYRSGYGTFSLLPDFTGLSQASAIARANSLGITVKFVGDSGTVVSQDYPASKRIDKISGVVTLTLSSSLENKKEEEELDKEEEEELDKEEEDNDDEDESLDDDDSDSEVDNTPVSPTPTPSESPSIPSGDEDAE